MIALLLALAAPADPPKPPPASIDGLPIGGLPRQALPARGCAAYLFSTGNTRTFAAMALADPAVLRLTIDGKTADYPRTAQRGDAVYGLSASSEYRAGDVSATLDITIAARDDVANGAVISTALLRVDRAGKDSIVMPLGGLIGCRP